MSANDRQEITFEKGTGNVFADLAIEGADELFVRAKIGFHVCEVLKDKRLADGEIGSLLGIGQQEVSHLLNGHFSQFTTDTLLGFLRRLDRKVSICISRHNPGEPYQEVAFGL
jgi:predicted XRE-type DNA-binding protein